MLSYPVDKKWKRRHIDRVQSIFEVRKLVQYRLSSACQTWPEDKRLRHCLNLLVASIHVPGRHRTLGSYLDAHLNTRPSIRVTEDLSSRLPSACHHITYLRVIVLSQMCLDQVRTFRYAMQRKRAIIIAEGSQMLPVSGEQVDYGIGWCRYMEGT